MCQKISPKEAKFEIQQATHKELINLGKLIKHKEQITKITKIDTNIYDINKMALYLCEWDDLDKDKQKKKMLQILNLNTKITQCLNKSDTLILKLNKKICVLDEDLDYHQGEENKYFDEYQCVLKKYKKCVSNMYTLKHDIVCKNTQLCFLVFFLFFTNCINYYIL